MSTDKDLILSDKSLTLLIDKLRESIRAYLLVPFWLRAQLLKSIFFELKHYKPNKSRNSTRCWAFFELDEIIDGEIRCEWVSIFITTHII